MNANEAYTICLYIAGKNLQQGYLSPEDFNTKVMPIGQRSYLDFLLGEYQQYKVGRPIAVVEIGQNARVRNSLAPLIYGTLLSPNVTTGIAAYPSDHEYPDAMWGQYGFYNIRFIQQDRLDSYYHSEIDPVATNPVYLIKHEGFQFYPENIGTTRLSYVRTPPAIIWGYLPDYNGINQYNPATSQDPVWGDTDMMEVIARGMRAVGVNLQSNQISQYANELKDKGQ